MSKNIKDDFLKGIITENGKIICNRCDIILQIGEDIYSDGSRVGPYLCKKCYEEIKEENKNEKDYVTIGLAQCIINSWKEYKNYEKTLQKRLLERGFKETDSWDVESFISDRVIGDEMRDGNDFELEVLDYLKEDINND